MATSVEDIKQIFKIQGKLPAQSASDPQTDIKQIVETTKNLPISLKKKIGLSIQTFLLIFITLAFFGRSIPLVSKYCQWMPTFNSESGQYSNWILLLLFIVFYIFNNIYYKLRTPK